jgi:hypothetical protein
MGVTFDQAARNLDEAVRVLFGSDERIQAVGIGRNEGGYGFSVIRNRDMLIPYGGRAQPLPEAIGGVPVVVEDDGQDLKSFARIPMLPEQGRYRQVVCGLQIQNYDEDDRDGIIAGGYIRVGTLGCFVEWNGTTCILSNAHVLSPSGKGSGTKDRILQPGGVCFAADDQVAVLEKCLGLAVTHGGGNPTNGTAVLNKADAAVASLLSDPFVKHEQRYIGHHLSCKYKICGTADAAVGDSVFKIGRTTGLTHGRVKLVSVVSGPFRYEHGECWFDESIVIEPEPTETKPFAGPGDSGSVVVKNDGMIIGLLYGGGGLYTFASPIATVLKYLSCKLIF